MEEGEVERDEGAGSTAGGDAGVEGFQGGRGRCGWGVGEAHCWFGGEAEILSWSGNREDGDPARFKYFVVSW